MSQDGMLLKICGITRLVDALHCAQNGATALGFVFWPKSPRAIEPDRAREIVAALPTQVLTVGVFVNEAVDDIRRTVERTGIAAVQLHGDEAPEAYAAIGRPLLRSVTLDDVEETAGRWPAGTTLLLDAFDRERRGGTGTPVDWGRAAALARHYRIVLAGGLTPLNVGEAIRMVRPAGVDVSSGVEEGPGVKDFEKVSRFLENARGAFALI